jgi:hypothetical protein
MLLEAWLFVGAIALAASGVALLTSDDNLAMITGVMGFVGWGIWTFGALNLEVARDATVYTYSLPSVAIIGIAVALIPGFIALTGPVEVIGQWRSINQRDL